MVAWFGREFAVSAAVRATPVFRTGALLLAGGEPGGRARCAATSRASAASPI